MLQSLLKDYSDIYLVSATWCSAWCADSVKQLCQQYSGGASHVKQGLQDEALQLQADFQRRLADWDDDMLKLGSSHFSRYFQPNSTVHRTCCMRKAEYQPAHMCKP